MTSRSSTNRKRDWWARSTALATRALACMGSCLLFSTGAAFSYTLLFAELEAVKSKTISPLHTTAICRKGTYSAPIVNQR